MVRTTVYLPEGLKERLEKAAEQSGRSEAEIVREGVERIVAEIGTARPRIPLFASRDPTLAERAEEALAGFGES